jgi:hypothetical protein
VSWNGLGATTVHVSIMPGEVSPRITEKTWGSSLCATPSLGSQSPQCFWVGDTTPASELSLCRPELSSCPRWRPRGLTGSTSKISCRPGASKERALWVPLSSRGETESRAGKGQAGSGICKQSSVSKVSPNSHQLQGPQQWECPATRGPPRQGRAQPGQVPPPAQHAKVGDPLDHHQVPP